MTITQQIEKRIEEYRTKLEEPPLPGSVHFVNVADYANRIKELQWALKLIQEESLQKSSDKV